MAITLTPQPTGSVITLPDGLRWSDEIDWSPVVQAAEWSLTGALIVESATKQAGRPVTLTGGVRWAWMARTDLLALRAAVTVADAQFLLTLHDGRAGLVIPRQDGDGPITAAPVPAVFDSGFADPGTDAKYYLDQLRFWSLNDGDF